jgi:5-methylcytosine-specific restriction protein B
MEIKKKIEQNGAYNCDIDITVEEWKAILLDNTLMSINYTNTLLQFHAEPEHKSTCKAIGDIYGISPQSINAIILNFGKAVQKKINRFQVVDANGKPTFWIIPMTGKSKGKHFEWTLRPELVQAIEDVLILEFYVKFKKLLEYFVSHLEWVVNGDKEGSRYNKYIKELIEANTFKRTGQGYKGDNIQNQISKLEKYPNGKICINIQPNFGKYQSKKCYLNWGGTGINIVVNWKGEKIKSLKQDHYLHWSDKPERKRITEDVTMDNLGLFDNKDSVTEDLKGFYNSFNKEIIRYNSQLDKNRQMQAIKPYLDLLEANKNLILTGAPGTGKTFLAKKIAEELGEHEFVQFHPSYDYTDFVEGLRPIKKEGNDLGFELRDGVFKEFCKKAIENLNNSSKTEEELKKEDVAHENISEFLDFCIEEGIELELSTGNKFTIIEYNESVIKVNVPNNLITSSLIVPIIELYSLVISQEELDKVKEVRTFFNRSHNRQSDSYIFTIYNDKRLNKEFKTSTEVTREERKKYVIIIDEINRAEISKVFGELFFSIDPGYRGEKGRVKTQYANLQDSNDVFYDGFYVPENVYIIGTMNDIDRSVESMDFAMRRRFAWKEVTAEERMSMWDGQIDDWKEEAITRLKKLNEKIENIQGLNSAYHIGPAYFLKLEKYKEEKEPFEHLWNNHIKGVLFEYLRGLPNATEILNNLKSTYELKEG